VHLLTKLGAKVHLIAPPTLMSSAARAWGAEIFHDMERGLAGADVVMMLRLQRERMAGGLIPSSREFFRFYGLDAERLKRAKPGALVMHPGPMNRGVEIDSSVADDPNISLIERQVKMGVALRMAVLEALAGVRA
jgi:aspartate carbamoyltransferase catalytic subunit